MSLPVILDEFEVGCFYSDEYLSEAYTTLLLHLLDASPADRQDPRLPEFLRLGYEAYDREQGGEDLQAGLTYRMAQAMIGGSSGTPSHPESPTGPTHEELPPSPASLVQSPERAAKRPPRPNPSRKPHRNRKSRFSSPGSVI